MYDEFSVGNFYIDKYQIISCLILQVFSNIGNNPKKIL